MKGLLWIIGIIVFFIIMAVIFEPLHNKMRSKRRRRLMEKLQIEGGERKWNL